MRFSTRLIFVFLLLCCAAGITASPARASSAPGTPGCNFDALKKSLYGTESAGGDYYIVNKTSGAAGRYQFMPATLAAIARRNPQCGPAKCGITTELVKRECHKAQECYMDALTNENLQAIKKNAACQKLLAPDGRTIGGSKNKHADLSCKATLSGLLAAWHLGGNECPGLLSNGHGEDDTKTGGGTQAGWYACHHKDLPVPGDCTPVPQSTSGNNVANPTHTQAQLDFTGINLSGPLDPLREWWDAALMLMAEQFTLNMEAQVQAVGMMFDAKHQLETQRLFQQKVAEAHKDYHPSEQMCTFGTFARDLMATERHADLTRTVIAERILEKEVGQGDSMYSDTAEGVLSRIGHFRKVFCEPSDNVNGLSELCPSPGPAEMRNRDIDYTRTLDQVLSLDINFNDAVLTQDEDAVFALVDNLFATDPLPRAPEESVALRKYNYNYLNLRSVVAMRGIARNSIANIVAMKTATPNRDDQTNAPYLRALLREFGLQDDEIHKVLGENPSYYAQMEFLTRKIYQNPLFYTNLYDKPANIQRIRAAMRAIKLMQDRDIQAALQRREMLMSMLLELKVREEGSDVYNALEDALFNNPITTPAAKEP